MSSSRRRGRSSGSPATGRPAAAVDEAPEAVAAEASQDAAPAETETAAIPEVPAETSPETVQAAVTDSVTETAEQAAETVEAVQDETAATVAEAAEQTADAVEQTTETVEAAQAQVVDNAAEAVEQATETVQAGQAQAVEHAAETVDQVAETAMTLAAAPLAAVEAATEATRAPLDASAKSFAKATGARFTFIPTFEPLNEINATLLAFARGESEAAVAHFQALSKAKSPAEAMRLQVTEFQRAADASLTCFSHILRSANRFSGPARWN
ncbi:phasin family protein [Methylorubrum sp. SB2]|uniref:phasin family protein n=1 Tax=Methylorubrum subtropicum TaxID=3138812 RepID=UPI00313E85E6